MKQEHFIQALRRGLANLPKKEVDEIIADYCEYIGDAVAAGRNEAEVIAALGDPAKLARELKAQACYREWESNRSISNLMRVVVSMAGLGVINFLLFFPFMVYLLLLTTGYMLSVGLMIAGVVMVIGAGGNKLFNWPHFHGPHFGAISLHGHPNLERLSDGTQQHDVHGVEGVQIEKDRFVFKLDDGEEANLVLAGGTPVTLESDKGKISVDSDDAKTQAMFASLADGGVSIASKDVKAINIENSNGENFSYVAGKNSGDTHWHVHSNDGDVVIDQDAKHGLAHLAASDGQDAVSIDANQISINDGDDHIHVGIGTGWSMIMTVLLFGIGFMIVGALGLWLCIWMSRLTWHGLSRYVKYQISVVMGKESLASVE